METENKLSQPMGYKKPIMSVGEEFLAWAETYWLIDKKYEVSKEPQTSESCSYDIVKKAFVDQINDIIKSRVKNYF